MSFLKATFNFLDLREAYPTVNQPFYQCWRVIQTQQKWRKFYVFRHNDINSF